MSGEAAEGKDQQPAQQPGDDSKSIAAENKRLREIASRYDAIVKDREAKESEAAAKRGEWEKLAEQHRAKADALAKELDARNGAYAELEAHIKGQVSAALEGIEDEPLRKQWSSALDGLPPIKQHQMLAALESARRRDVAAPSERTGASGRQAGEARTPTRAELAGSDPTARRQLLTELLPALGLRPPARE